MSRIDDYIDAERGEAQNWILQNVLRPYDLVYRGTLRQARAVAGEIRSRKAFLTSSHLRHMDSVRALWESVSARVTNVAISAGRRIEDHSGSLYERGVWIGAALAAEQLKGKDEETVAGLLVQHTLTAALNNQLVIRSIESSLPKSAERFGPRLASLLEDRLVERASTSRGDISDSEMENLIDETWSTGAAWFTGMFLLAIWSLLTSGVLDFGSINAAWLRGWMWYAQLDHKTCPSCIWLHGRIFAVSERFLDHPNGRCMPIPLVLTAPPWLGGVIVEGPREVQSGEDWFNELSDEEKKEILGSAHFYAYQDGAITLDDMSEVYNHAVYGPIRRMPSLKSILGPEADKYYRLST